MSFDSQWKTDNAGTSNADQITLDTLDVSSVTNMREMFRNCSSLDQSFASWDVSSVTNMREMFRNCSSLDQSFASWAARALLIADDGWTITDGGQT